MTPDPSYRLLVDASGGCWSPAFREVCSSRLKPVLQRAAPSKIFFCIIVNKMYVSRIYVSGARCARVDGPRGAGNDDAASFTHGTYHGLSGLEMNQRGRSCKARRSKDLGRETGPGVNRKRAYHGMKIMWVIQGWGCSEGQRSSVLMDL